MQPSCVCALGASLSQPGRRRPPPPWAPSALAGGFTLIELMVTVAVLAITLAIGVPSMQNFLTARAVVSQAEDLASTLRLARSDALRLNSIVTVCPSASPNASAPTCAGNTAEWGTGWVSFVDLNNDGALDTGERVLRVQSPSSATDGVTNDSAGAIKFYRNGLPDGSAEFEVKPKVDAESSSYNTMLRRVELSAAGRAVVLAGQSGS